MARPIPLVSVIPLHMFSISSIYVIFAVVLVLSILSLVTFLCASHRRQKDEAFTKKRLAISRKKLLESFSKANNISSKALLKMVSWRKQVQHRDDESNKDYCDINSHDYMFIDDDDDDDFEAEDAVWKKTIIKGEKCKPLDFSGKIDYDSEGNLLPDHDKSLDDK